MDSYAFFHDDPREGPVAVCRMLLHHRYPRYAADGYEALYPRPPAIYISAAGRPGLGQHICSQLGLPQSCLTVIPLVAVGTQTRMVRTPGDAGSSSDARVPCNF